MRKQQPVKDAKPGSTLFLDVIAEAKKSHLIIVCYKQMMTIEEFKTEVPADDVCMYAPDKECGYIRVFTLSEVIAEMILDELDMTEIAMEEE